MRLQRMRTMANHCYNFISVSGDDLSGVEAFMKECMQVNDVKSKLELAVSLHFDVPSVGLCDTRDFNMPFDYEQPYEFILYNGEEYVTLIMTYAPIY